MNKTTDILIIGGGPAGMVSAGTARGYYPNKKVTVIKANEHSLVPCGIPYIFGNMLESTSDNIVPCEERSKKFGIDLAIDEVIKLNFEDKKVTCKSGDTYSYDKLILATGSTPNRDINIKNIDVNGVYFVPKDSNYLSVLEDKLINVKKVVIIGAGFIGVEMAGELADSDKNVNLIGSKVLKHAFDSEFSTIMKQLLLEKNINIHENIKVEEIITKDEKAVGVKLNSGEIIECEAVILATGYKANTKLAKESGMSMREFDTIYVDEYMRTTKKNVFAVGDCAQKRHFITKRTINTMLASTATAEARIAVSNLYEMNFVKAFSGTINTFSTVVSNHCFASVGLTEEDANKQNFNVQCATFESDSKHPAKLPNNSKISVKLVAMRNSGVIIGAQIIGGIDAGEMINILSVIIEKQMTIFELINLQVATHPLLTAAPTAYPIIKVAESIVMERYKNL